MKKTTRSNHSKLTIGVATGALIALPLLAPSTHTAEAQLGRIFRNQQNVGTRGTMNATVTRDLGGNRFEVRADDNRLFTVRTPQGEPRRLNVGDRVQLTGVLNNNNVFVADDIRIISNTTTTNGNSGTMAATVTRDLGGNRFEVRADDNRLFTVRSREGEPRRLSVGDRVELTGYINNGNVFVAEDVRLVSNARNNNRNNNNRNNNRNNRNNRGNRSTRNAYGTRNGDIVDFNATVVSSNGNYIEVRGDNGRTYNVRIPNRSTFARGERIRVVGTFANGNVQATSVARF